MPNGHLKLDTVAASWPKPTIPMSNKIYWLQCLNFLSPESSNCSTFQSLWTFPGDYSQRPSTYSKWWSGALSRSKNLRSSHHFSESHQGGPM